MRAITRRKYFNYDASDVDSVEEDYDILMQSNRDAAQALASRATITPQLNMTPIYIAGAIAVFGIILVLIFKKAKK